MAGLDVGQEDIQLEERLIIPNTYRNNNRGEDEESIKTKWEREDEPTKNKWREEEEKIRNDIDSVWDNYEEETSFNTHDDSFTPFRAFHQDDDDVYRGESSFYQHARTLYENPPLENVLTGVDEKGYWISGKNKNSVKYYVTDNGIENNKGKIIKRPPDIIEKALGKLVTKALSENKVEENNVQIEMVEINSELNRLREENERLNLKEQELKNKVKELIQVGSQLRIEVERLQNKIRQAEEELEKYNVENRQLKERLRNNPTTQNQEEQDRLNREIRDIRETILDYDGELQENRINIHNQEIEIDNLKHEIERLKRDHKNKIKVLEERQKELELMLEEKTLQLEDIEEGRLSLFSKMGWRQRVKYIFKEHGLTIFSITAAVGTIITAIVTNVTSAVAGGFKTVKSMLFTLSKEILKILPGMIGTIASFLFKTAGEVFGFLANNAWLLILFVVTFVIEQMISKKK